MVSARNGGGINEAFQELTSSLSKRETFYNKNEMSFSLAPHGLYRSKVLSKAIIESSEFESDSSNKKKKKRVASSAAE